MQIMEVIVNHDNTYIIIVCETHCVTRFHYEGDDRSPTMTFTVTFPHSRLHPRRIMTSERGGCSNIEDEQDYTERR